MQQMDFYERGRNRLAVGRMYVEGRSAYKPSCIIIDLDEFVSSNIYK